PHPPRHSFPTRRSSDLIPDVEDAHTRRHEAARHDARLLTGGDGAVVRRIAHGAAIPARVVLLVAGPVGGHVDLEAQVRHDLGLRSEEHTSELQSLAYLV